jgi:DNA ligase 1
MFYEPLYKKTSTGAIQTWHIAVVGSTIITQFGQVGGKMQLTQDTIDEGKNVGRSNETTAEEQAEAEASSQWEKKLKKGYVTTIEAAEAGEVDAIIEGGINPMLAFPFEKQGHKIKYPCFVQPKIDGTRCIAIVTDGVCTLWSRTRKPITSMPHIVKAVEQLGRDSMLTDFVLDGELYSHDLNEDFEQIIHFVRQENAAEGSEAIQYWVYDLPGPGDFAYRNDFMNQQLSFKLPLVQVATRALANETEAMDYFASCQQQRFEGAMLRNSAGLYVGKRSSDLIKLKSFQDDEFEIVGVEEGRGKLQQSVGAFVCKTASGATFKAKLMGSLDKLKEHWTNQDKLIGQKLTVKFQNLTTDGLPRFPVAVALRNYE